MFRIAEDFNVLRHEVGALHWDEFKRYVAYYRYKDILQEAENKKIAAAKARAANRA